MCSAGPTSGDHAIEHHQRVVGVPRVRLHDVRAAERKLDRRAVAGHEDKGVTGSGMRPLARSAWSVATSGTTPKRMHGIMSDQDIDNANIVVSGLDCDLKEWIK